MNERIQERLADLKARQLAGEQMSCPRCGRKTMKDVIHTNALSRQADIYVCDQCYPRNTVIREEIRSNLCYATTVRYLLG